MRPTLVYLLLSAATCCCQEPAQVRQDDRLASQDLFLKPGLSAAEIIKARGFLAEDRQVVAEDGFVLTLTRATNPLICNGRGGLPDREPILFVHGTMSSPSAFLVNSADARPANFSGRIDLRASSLDRLIGEFRDEPSAKSLAFFALNFGFEIWLLHRRGTVQGRRRRESSGALAPLLPFEKFLHNHRKRRARSPAPAQPLAAGQLRRSMQNTKLFESIDNLPAALADYDHLWMDLVESIEPSLWNFSMDEQAAYDMPAAVEHILETSGRQQVATVSASGGAGIVLMSLIINPELNGKLSQNELWAPAFSMGHAGNDLGGPLNDRLLDYLGPWPPTFLVHPWQGLLQLLCSLEPMQRTVCELISDLSQGHSSGQEPMRSDFYSHISTPASTLELRQLIQSARKGSTHFFDFAHSGRNQRAYGTPWAPRYELAAISNSRLTFWIGDDDALVSVADLESIFRELRGEFASEGFIGSLRQAKVQTPPPLHPRPAGSPTS